MLHLCVVSVNYSSFLANSVDYDCSSQVSACNQDPCFHLLWTNLDLKTEFLLFGVIRFRPVTDPKPH